MTRVSRVGACLALAIATFREHRRRRLLSGAMLVAAAALLLGLLGARASLFAPARLVVDLGLAAASLLGTGVAAACAIGTVAGGGQRQSELVLLSRPIGRGELLLGRYLGLAAVLVCWVAIIGGGIAGGCWLAGGKVPIALWPALWQTAVELWLSLALAFALASACSGPLAATLFAAFFLAGQLADELRLLADQLAAGSLGRWLASAAFCLMPDYPRLSLRGLAAADLPVPAGLLWQATLYGLFSAAAWLLVAGSLYGARTNRAA